jgi:antitoxin Phd
MKFTAESMRATRCVDCACLALEKSGNNTSKKIIDFQGKMRIIVTEVRNVRKWSFVMTRIAANDARKDFADTINRVAYAGERIVVHRRGKDVAALVSVEDLAILESLEDMIDLAEARESLKESGSISWEKLKMDLGL